LSIEPIDAVLAIFLFEITEGTRSG